jgi:hypothetical protein
MVNEIFLLFPKWENFAGPTWSTRRLLPPLSAPESNQAAVIKSFSELARLSHWWIANRTAWESFTGSYDPRHALGEASAVQ